MELLRATDLVYRYPDQREPLLLGATLTLRAGEKVGLVGRNGAGKSTLLKLLAKQFTLDEGLVLRAPGLRVAYLPQGGGEVQGTLWEHAAGALAHVQQLEASLRDEEVRLSQGEDRALVYSELTEQFERAGGYGAEAALRASLGRLGFSEEDDARDAETLSGGERARLALARALAEHPDVLLLDEPSSFLDLPTRRWLGGALKKHPAALLLASHDRALLDAVTTHTLHLHVGSLTRYRGAYSHFRAQSEHESVRAAREAKRSARARTLLAARVAAQPTAPRRRALQQRLARLEGMGAPIDAPPTRTGAALAFRTETPRSRQPLLEARHLRAERGERVLLGDGFLRLYAGEKLAIVGANGSGKTTLLRLLAGNETSSHRDAALHYAAGTRLARFDQHARGLEGELAVGEQLTRVVSEPRARSLLALVELSGAWDKPAETLSEGERARAGLALVMATEANLLLLDEPSEHLDAEMIERLESALIDTDAAVVLVTHDAALVEGVAERMLSLEGGELKEYRGGLKGFFAGTFRLEPDLPELPSALQNALQDATRSAERAEDLEARLERLEDEAIALEDRLADPTGLSERERERSMRRLSELTHARAELYDARLPPPGPAYRAVRSGVTVWTDGSASAIGDGGGGGAGQRAVLESSAGLTLHLFAEGTTGHLVRVPARDRCVLPWAQGAVLRGAVQLAFEHLELRALQLQREEELPPDELDTASLDAASFQPAGDGWWLLDRDRYEQLAGYAREGSARAPKARPRHKPQGKLRAKLPRKPQRKRRLTFATDYAAWAAKRRRSKP